MTIKLTDEAKQAILSGDPSKWMDSSVLEIRAPAPVFSLADIETIRKIPSDEFVRIYDAVARATLLTRRQRKILDLLDKGWVAELQRPASAERIKPSRRFILRSPQSQETDGPIVIARTIEALLDAGVAVRVKAPWMANTWVFSRKLYEQSPAGRGDIGPSTTPSTAPPV